MMGLLRRFLGAVQFLTLVPLAMRTAAPGRCALFFPLAGALIGAGSAAVFVASAKLWPSPLAALLALSFSIGVTGGLHEDGLADVADAFRAGRTPSRIAAILKDSRIGTYGASALLIVTLVRWQGIAALPGERAVTFLIAGPAVARAAIVALAWIVRPAGMGLGAGFSAELTSATALAAIAQGYVLSLWCGMPAAVWIAGLTAVAVLAARRWYERRLGGANGDCLGALSPMVEAIVYLVGAAT